MSEQERCGCRLHFRISREDCKYPETKAALDEANLRLENYAATIDILEQTRTELNSERSRRVTAQEAIVTHWQPQLDAANALGKRLAEALKIQVAFWEGRVGDNDKSGIIGRDLLANEAKKMGWIGGE